MIHIKNIFLKILKKVMMNRGYSSYFALKVPAMIQKDLFKNKSVSLKQKIWAYRRGFLSSRVNIYGINESNYKNHMPDLDYYKLHPINGKQAVLIDDKLNMKYTLSSFNEYMPKYYFQLEQNEILRLMDCPGDISSDINGISKLLKQEGCLALKMLSGSLGLGFYKLSYKDNKFYINTEASNSEEIEKLLSTLTGYLVTEYIVSHDSIKKVYNATPNTLRVQVIRNKNKNPKIIGSFIRYGTKKSGVLESPLAGGIIAGVDLTTGKTFDPKIIIDQSLKNIKYHPDTNEDLEILLPRWKDITSKVEEISNYLPQLTYMGFDIIVTNNSFKIIEINSLTAPTVISYYYPIFENESGKEFFVQKFKSRSDHFRRILNLLGDL